MNIKEIYKETGRLKAASNKFLMDMQMNDEFKDHPQSVAEIRANKAKSGAKWTPRDALISLLRDIDNGVDIDMLIVGYRCQDENDKKNDTFTYLYHQATPNLLTAMGLLDMTKELIKRNGT